MPRVNETDGVKIFIDIISTPKRQCVVSEFRTPIFDYDEIF